MTELFLKVFKTCFGIRREEVTGQWRRAHICNPAESSDRRSSVDVFLASHVLGQTRKTSNVKFIVDYSQK